MKVMISDIIQAKQNLKLKKELEHERDVRLNKNNAKIAQLHQKTSIKIDFENPQKISLLRKQKHNIKKEAVEILNCRESCKALEHAGIKASWGAPTSGTVVMLKTGRREVPGSNLVALVDLAVRSFPWFSPKLI